MVQFLGRIVYRRCKLAMGRATNQIQTRRETMSWFEQEELRRQIKELETRVRKLEGKPVTPQCGKCGIELEKLIDHTSTGGGILCNDVECPGRNVYRRDSTAF